jgi:enamine deaminase RidA (YjgF/YER057c/UK114 family)
MTTGALAQIARTRAAATPLRALRAGAADAAVLGRVDYAPPLARVAGPQHADLWLGGATLREGRSGLARWRSCGDWTFGSVEISEGSADGGADLAGPAARAYHDLFAALAEAGTPHLLRLWNFLPRINDTGGGLERYRQFNIGRQQAFLDAGRSAFDGAPAACALGSASDRLVLHFLAGRTPVRPVENPRQLSAYRYPAQYGPRAPTFSRAALAELGAGTVGLFVSGTASIVGHRSLHVGDVTAQTVETVQNLRALLAEAGARCTAPLTLAALSAVVYLRRPDDLPAVRAALAGALGREALERTLFLRADICRAELLVEIEGHLVLAGTLR